MYLGLFKLPTILTNPFGPPLFMHSQSIKLLPTNFPGSFSFPGDILTNSRSLECSSILIWPYFKHLHHIVHTSLTNLIWNFKCVLINANFWHAMHPFSSWYRRMHLVVYTDSKLDKSLSSIICLEVFFDWDFTFPISFCTILYCNFQGQPCLVRSEILPMPSYCFLKFRVFLAITRWLIFLAIFTIFILISLEFLVIIWDVRNFPMLKEKNWCSCRKIVAY